MTAVRIPIMIQKYSAVCVASRSTSENQADPGVESEIKKVKWGYY